MTIQCQENPRNVPDGCPLCDAVRLCSPFGEEPVIVTLNGRKMPVTSAVRLIEGDRLQFFPVLIGG